MQIRTNQPSGTYDLRNLQQSTHARDTNLARLATGLRINAAADDSAGLAISESLRAQIQSLNQASRSATDGISMMEIADGGLNAISDSVVRARELAVQAGSGVLSMEDQKAITTELAQINKEVGAIAGQTKFNGVSLLNQPGGSLAFQVGADGGQTISVPLGNFSIGAGTKMASFGALVGALSSAVGTSGYANAAQGLVAAADAALGYINASRSDLGAVQNRFASVVSSIEHTSTNLAAADSRIRDADIATESSLLAKNQILSQAGVSVLAQANQHSQVALRLLG